MIMNNLPFRKLNTATLILVVAIIILMFQGANFSFNNYNNQLAEQQRQAANKSATIAAINVNETKNLIKAIDKSDEISDNQTKYLLAQTLRTQDRNLAALENATNQTNTLINYLTENFGSQSGYLERENFQYQQANRTFTFLEEAIANQKKGLAQQDIIIENQHTIISNQQKILNQTQTTK